MMNLECTDRKRRGSRVVEYTLRDRDGKRYYFEAHVLKERISCGDVSVSNLKLTNDNKLMGIKPSAKFDQAKACDKFIECMAKASGKYKIKIKDRKVLIREDKSATVQYISEPIGVINRNSELMSDPLIRTMMGCKKHLKVCLYFIVYHGNDGYEIDAGLAVDEWLQNFKLNNKITNVHVRENAMDHNVMCSLVREVAKMCRELNKA